MKIILNDIKDLSIENMHVYKNRIYYEIENIRINGLFIRVDKNMIFKNNKYVVKLNKNIEILNNYFKKSFILNNSYPSIEVIINNKTKDIFNDKNKYIVLNFMSINDNNYPKIHILSWNE